MIKNGGLLELGRRRCKTAKIHADPGAYGFYPLIDRQKGYYLEIVARGRGADVSMGRRFLVEAPSGTGRGPATGCHVDIPRGSTQRPRRRRWRGRGESLETRVGPGRVDAAAATCIVRGDARRHGAGIRIVRRRRGARRRGARRRGDDTRPAQVRGVAQDVPAVGHPRVPAAAGKAARRRRDRGRPRRRVLAPRARAGGTHAGGHQLRRRVLPASVGVRLSGRARFLLIVDTRSGRVAATPWLGPG